MSGEQRPPVPIYGAGIGGTGRALGACGAPAYAREYFPASCDFEVAWREVVRREGTSSGPAALEDVVDFSGRLATVLRRAVENGARPLVVSGDHTAAVGVWSGVATALPPPLGLIWVDAHMDLHTLESSHSGNLHGMPLASLLGLGHRRLTQLSHTGPKILPRHVVLLGARDYEEEERLLVERLNLRWYSGKLIAKRGFQEVLAEAEAYLLEQVDAYGLSLIWISKPEEVKGVGTPVEGGVKLGDCLEPLRRLDRKALRAVEIAELNPILDEDKVAVKAVWQLASALFA